MRGGLQQHWRCSGWGCARSAGWAGVGSGWGCLPKDWVCGGWGCGRPACGTCLHLHPSAPQGTVCLLAAIIRRQRLAPTCRHALTQHSAAGVPSCMTDIWAMAPSSAWQGSMHPSLPLMSATAHHPATSSLASWPWCYAAAVAPKVGCPGHVHSSCAFTASASWLLRHLSGDCCRGWGLQGERLPLLCRKPDHCRSAR